MDENNYRETVANLSREWEHSKQSPRFSVSDSDSSSYTVLSTNKNELPQSLEKF